MAGWEEIALKTAAKAAAGGALIYLKNRTENMRMQYEVIDMQETFRARERAEMMRTAVALMQAGKLDTSNVETMMQALEGGKYEYGLE